MAHSPANCSDSLGEMVVKELFHLVLAAAFLFSAFYENFKVEYPKVGERWLGHAWRYLPIWNLHFQALFFTLSVLGDVLGRLRKTRPCMLDKVLDISFASIGFPLASLTATNFMMSDDRFVFIQLLPGWLAFVIHFLSMPALGLEIMIVDHNHAIHQTWNRFVLGIFYVLNVTWVLYIGSMHNCFVYPYFETLSLLQQLFFMMLSSSYIFVPCNWEEYKRFLIWRGFNIAQPEASKN